MNNIPKRHHYVSKFYQKNFSDSNRVILYDKLCGSNPHKLNISNALIANLDNTWYDNGVPNNELESEWADLESDLAPTLNRLNNNIHSFSPDDDDKILIKLAANLFVRSRSATISFNEDAGMSRKLTELIADQAETQQDILDSIDFNSICYDPYIQDSIKMQIRYNAKGFRGEFIKHHGRNPIKGEIRSFVEIVASRHEDSRLPIIESRRESNHMAEQLLSRYNVQLVVAKDSSIGFSFSDTPVVQVHRDDRVGPLSGFGLLDSERIFLPIGRSLRFVLEIPKSFRQLLFLRRRSEI